jgi:Fe-S cluster assembly iron-binding protein IscA
MAEQFRSAITAESDVIQVKAIEVTSPEIQHVFLFVGLKAESEERVGIRVQLHPSGDQYMPVNLTLAMLAEDGEVVQTVEAGEQDSYIQLKRFRCPIGSRFQLQVALNGYSLTESFEV